MEIKNKQIKNILIFLSCFFIMQISFALSKTSQENALFKAGKQREKIFIDKMVKAYHFNRSYLVNLFSHIKFPESVIQNMNTPYEEKPWYIYKKTLLTKDRILKGVKYQKDNYKFLIKEKRKYGVPPSIVVAIIGIESFYGKYKGKYPILDSLAMLAFFYPQRGNFFQGELAQYLLLTRKLNINPTKMKGSYAGAMGIAQFMPSTYMHYAVDFDKNGNKNLFGNADAIGSIGNFLKKFGWKRNSPIESYFNKTEFFGADSEYEVCGVFRQEVQVNLCSL